MIFVIMVLKNIVLMYGIIYDYLRGRDLGLSEISARVQEGINSMEQVGPTIGSE